MERQSREAREAHAQYEAHYERVLASAPSKIRERAEGICRASGMSSALRYLETEMRRERVGGRQQAA
jgi:hypothetical protein